MDENLDELIRVASRTLGKLVTFDEFTNKLTKGELSQIQGAIRVLDLCQRYKIKDQAQTLLDSLNSRGSKCTWEEVDLGKDLERFLRAWSAV